MIPNQHSTPADAGQNSGRTTIKLSDLIGTEVTLQNVASVNMEDGKLQIQMNGILEGPEDEGGDYYLRVKDCYWGCSGIYFTERHLTKEYGIHKQPSGRIEITLN